MGVGLGLIAWGLGCGRDLYNGIEGRARLSHAFLPESAVRQPSARDPVQALANLNKTSDRDGGAIFFFPPHSVNFPHILSKSMKSLKAERGGGGRPRKGAALEADRLGGQHCPHCRMESACRVEG